MLTDGPWFKGCFSSVYKMTSLLWCHGTFSTVRELLISVRTAPVLIKHITSIRQDFNYQVLKILEDNRLLRVWSVYSGPSHNFWMGALLILPRSLKENLDGMVTNASLYKSKFLGCKSSYFIGLFSYATFQESASVTLVLKSRKASLPSFDICYGDQTFNHPKFCKVYILHIV